jgi:hypothetical protein
MRKAERAAYVAAGGAATVAETATSGDRHPRRSRRFSSIQGIVACRAWSDPDYFTASGRANVAAERSSICPQEKTDRANDLFPRGRSRKKEIFPSSHTTTSISDEILRGPRRAQEAPGCVLTLSCSFASLAIGGQTVDHLKKAKWTRRGGLRRVALWLAKSERQPPLLWR